MKAPWKSDLNSLSALDSWLCLNKFGTTIIEVKKIYMKARAYEEEDTAQTDFGVIRSQITVDFSEVFLFSFLYTDWSTLEGLRTLVLFRFEKAAQKKFIVGNFGIIFVEILTA